ncbi:MAG: hypothetical protein KDE19_05760 [Caldilineaceae bacterium]|nr:hypothetical protein [Caldilineaceae bacterium]
MSKARTKARRRQKQQRQSNRIWIGSTIAVIGLLLISTLFYVLTSQDDSTSAANTALPAATLADDIAAAIATAEATATADLLDTTATVAALQPGPADACRRHPRFAGQLGFNERAFLSTSVSSIKGLVLIQPADGDTPERVYQDPTWDDAGYLGHMTFDPIGNVYVFPSPRESLVDNPPEGQNTLYRVDTDSAAMTVWLPLESDIAPSSANPYGVMGTTYDCDTQSLYASTVAGSTASEEIGKIVRIDVATAAVVAELQGIDPFGLSIYNEVQQEDNAVTKRLYFGAARAAEVYSILLDTAGDFVGQPQLELLLPDSSLKPWRIVWDTNGDLVVRAMPFDFNLIATSERIEVPFRFRRDESGLWQYIAE